jgi:hypothetical protein
MAMPIPPFTASGVIPPFLKNPATGECSPYFAQSYDVAHRFATSKRRCEILLGWIEHRKRLLEIGMAGFQWIDGSFCEDLTRANREPGDIDVVTFYDPPEGMDPDAFDEQLATKHLGLADPHLTKLTFLTDAYFVRLEMKQYAAVDSVHYWFGLFTHRRVDNLWKGIVQVPLDANDDARAQVVILARLGKFQPSGGDSSEQRAEPETL